MPNTLSPEMIQEVSQELAKYASQLTFLLHILLMKHTETLTRGLEIVKVCSSKYTQSYTTFLNQLQKYRILRQ